MERKNRDALIIYPSNIAGSFIPSIDHDFCFTGAILYGATHIAKMLGLERTRLGTYIRLTEALGALGYAGFAVWNAVQGVMNIKEGSFAEGGQQLLSAVTEGSIAYQLFRNEHAGNSLRHIGSDLGQIVDDVKDTADWARDTARTVKSRF